MPRFFITALLLIVAQVLSAAEPIDAEFFEKKVRPVLAEHCFSCHGAQAKEPKSGLRLDSRATLLKGGERGPAMVPGAPEKSRLIDAISYKHTELQMPPRGKLSDAAIADLTAWIKGGAHWPGGDAAIVEHKSGFDLAKRKAEHWCWQPVKVTPPPSVKNNSWPLTEVDRFILAKLEAAGLQPAAPAERRVWLRRVYFDLIGLPPTVEEIAAFDAACGVASSNNQDATPQATTVQTAMERVVDKLLASPHFGERWARHWLDLVRYAETRGHEFDPIIPNAYQYRDYVIRAFNADVPYNQFVTEHIAGDLMPKPRLDPKAGFNESILGTGFWHLGEEVHSPVDIRGDECDRNDNKIDVFSKTFLALTVSCARCHDHKFDAISQKDYYALSGFLLSGAYRQVRFDSMEWNDGVLQELFELRDKHRGAVQKALANAIGPGIDRIALNLMAARSAMLAGKPGDTEEVRRWVDYLAASAKDPSDPFHLWAALCSVGDTRFYDRFAELILKRRNTVLAQDDKPRPTKTIAISDLEGLTLKDQLLQGESPWLHDGFELDYRPHRHHPLRWSGNPNRPLLPLQHVMVTELDPFTRGLELAPGTEIDHGALGTMNRYGRTFLTEKFTLDHGKVVLLVKGRGRSYAAVDSHTLIAGPLHGRLIRDFDTGGKWDFVIHDLSHYQGHLLHLEVSPADDGGFALAAAINCERPPSIPAAEVMASPRVLLSEIVLGDPRTPGDIADEYASAVRRYAKQLLNTDTDRADHSQLLAPAANFVLSHPELLGVRDFPDMVAAARPYFAELAKIEARVRRQSRLAPAMWDVSPVNARIHIRGSHKALGDEVPRRFLEALAGPKGIGNLGFPGSGRGFLANQITDPAINPLAARVIVNRVWHHLFGRGIVASVDNFGVMGDKPTHPELLDYLADRFAKHGWSIKTLIRELVLSQTYRMSSAPPSDDLLPAARIKRLQGEAIRDAMLAVSGRLNATMHGKPVPVHLTEFLDGRGRPSVSGPLDGDGRRSIYTAVRRNFLPSFMLAFDTPSPFSTMGRRSVSNVPAQSLILMNDPFVHQQAERWGQRVFELKGDVSTKINQMYVSAFARPPTADELRRSREFVESRGANAAAWGDLAHVLFNVKEFIYIP